MPGKGCLWLRLLSRFVIAFPARSKCLLTSWLHDFGTQKSVAVSIVSWFICYQKMGGDDMILIYWMSRFKSTCLISTFISAKSSSNSSSVFCHLHIWIYWYFPQQFWFLFVLHQVTFCMMYFASKLNKWGDNKRALKYSFASSEQFHCCCLILYLLTCIQVSQEPGKVV